MARTVLITGGNIGDTAHYLARARQMIAERAGAIIAQSAVKESAPWGDMDNDAGMFMNQALMVETDLDPDSLLDVLNGIEKELGRERVCDAYKDEARKYLSRTMDIDIIFYDDDVIRSGRLTIPHPFVAEREFVLTLLTEIIPEYVHPVSGMTVAQMLEKLETEK